jgi:hypothetical protein
MTDVLKHDAGTLDFSTTKELNYSIDTSATQTITLGRGNKVFRFLIYSYGQTGTIGVRIDKDSGDFFTLPAGQYIPVYAPADQKIYIKNNTSGTLSVSVMLVRVQNL